MISEVGIMRRNMLFIIAFMLGISILVMPISAAAPSGGMYYEIPFRHTETKYYLYPIFAIYDPIGSNSYTTFIVKESLSFSGTSQISVDAGGVGGGSREEIHGSIAKNTYYTCQDSQHQGSEGDLIFSLLFKISVTWEGRIIVPKFGGHPYRVVDSVYTTAKYFALEEHDRYQLSSGNFTHLVNGKLKTYIVDLTALHKLEAPKAEGAYEYPSSGYLGMGENKKFDCSFTKYFTIKSSLNIGFHLSFETPIPGVPKANFKFTYTKTSVSKEQCTYNIYITDPHQEIQFKLESNYPFSNDTNSNHFYQDWIIWYLYSQ